jgi:long-chain acyl-CoA synthetase
VSPVLPDNLGYLFDVPLQTAPKSIAVLEDEARLTYEDLDARSNQVANMLAALDVRAGSRVALMCGNDARFLEALFGTMRLGAVAVPLNTRIGDEALSYIVNDADATVLIASAPLGTRARALHGTAPAVRHLVADGPAQEGSLDYTSLLQSASTVLPRRGTDPDEICMQPYTSGSTGRPKGVLLTHGGQVWNADVLRKAMLIDQEDRGLVAMPLYHKNAMAGVVKPFLLSGATIVLRQGFDAVDAIRAIERFKVTFLTGVPAMCTPRRSPRVTALRRAGLCP